MEQMEKWLKGLNERVTILVSGIDENIQTVQTRAAASEERDRILYEVGQKAIELELEPFTEEIARVRELSEIIEDCEKKLLYAKGKVKCANCNEIVSCESKFCPMCGAELPEIPKEEEVVVPTCQKCGRVIAEDMAFCPDCGAPTKEEPVSCPNCGKELDKEMTFCPSCGKKVKKAKK